MVLLVCRICLLRSRDARDRALASLPLKGLAVPDSELKIAYRYVRDKRGKVVADKATARWLCKYGRDVPSTGTVDSATVFEFVPGTISLATMDAIDASTHAAITRELAGSMPVAFGQGMRAHRQASLASALARRHRRIESFRADFLRDAGPVLERLRLIIEALRSQSATSETTGNGAADPVETC
jgi:hypothetical protein